MNISINLLPGEILARREQEQKRRLLLAAGGIILALFLIINGTLLASAMLARSQLNDTKEQRLALEQQAQSLKPFEELKARVAEVEALLQKVQGRAPDYNLLMSDIGLHIPATVRLTALTATFKPPAAPKPDAKADAKAAPESAPVGSGEVIIRGETFDHNSVAGWLEELRGVPALSDIRCQFSASDGAQTVQLVRFEIKATLNAAPKAAAAGSKAGD
ncbi:MAG TPA: hypothetical protein DEF34_01475 [Desulfotomaculum sp.]|nr:MAG: hypothetical protein JL56_17110 [Desulfotomaculum sp. BICA1-6]HBX22296.1 hypothetical protein [Desulfotomaculum sp.]